MTTEPTNERSATNVEVKYLKFVECPYCGDRQEWDYISTQTCGECCGVYQVVKATSEKAIPSAQETPSIPSEDLSDMLFRVQSERDQLKKEVERLNKIILDSQAG